MEGETVSSTERISWQFFGQKYLFLCIYTWEKVEEVEKSHTS